MILLDGHSLRIRDRFQPESMALILAEKNSSATIILGPEAPEITVKDWVKDETEPGKGIVWRVKTVSESVETRTRTITLEHVIQTLKDRVMFGETTPGTITGRKTDTVCTARQAAAYALSWQSDWKLGETAVNPSNPYTFNGDTVMAALETITSSLDSVQWEYDLSRYPFTLHIRKQPTGFQSEMRMSRNITSLRRQIDRSRMYTRIYPIGQNNLHIDGDYLSKNEGIWGTVCKVETDNSQDTKEKLRAWAQERLNRHCEPLVTITISGLDLSRSTGEPLDQVVTMRNCRVPLPDIGTTITARVQKTSWADKIREPERFTVTMANEAEDVASIINSLQKSGGKSGRAGAKKDEEDHAWFVDTADHVGMVAEAVAGPGADKDWSRVASIFVDGTGIHQRVVRTEGEIVTAQTAIEANEYAIELEAKRATDKETQLEGRIIVEAGKVALTVKVTDDRPIQAFPNRDYFPKFGNVDYIFLDNSTGTYYEWDKTKQRYVMTEPGKVIAAGNICTAINEATGDPEAVIEAKKIHLLGETIAQTITADYVKTKIASLTTVDMKGATVTGNLYIRNGSGNSQNVSGAIWDLWLYKDGNNYTLRRKRISDTGWVDVGTFSRATSLGGQWSGGKLTVTADDPDVPEYTRLLVAKSASGGRIPIYAQWGSSGQYEEDTGFSVPVPAAPTDLGIYDSNSQPVSHTTLNYGQSLGLWAGYWDPGSSAWVWGTGVYITAPNDRTRISTNAFTCSIAEEAGGTRYKYTLTASISSGQSVPLVNGQTYILYKQ